MHCADELRVLRTFRPLFFLFLTILSVLWAFQLVKLVVEGEAEGDKSQMGSDKVRRVEIFELWEPHDYE